MKYYRKDCLVSTPSIRDLCIVNKHFLKSSWTHIFSFGLFFCPLWLLGQTISPPSLTLKDLTDYRPLKGAMIVVFATDDQEILATGATDQSGRFSLQPDWLQRSLEIRISHSGYRPRTVGESMFQKSPSPVILLEPQSYDLAEVVFVANRHREHKSDIPHQIEVITTGDIRFRTPQTSADLLAQQGQIFVQKSQQGGGSPNLRGFEANKVLLVVDGIRMNNAIYRSGHLQNVITLDPAIIDRTEVLFGPGSVIYGSEALGGVMHFYTRSPQLSEGKKPHTEINIGTHYNTVSQAPSLHADLNLGFQRWGFFSSLSWNRFGDIRIGAHGRAAYPEWGLRPYYVATISAQDTVLPNPDPYRMVPGGYQQLDFVQKVSFVPNDRLQHQFQFQYSNSSDIPRFDRLTQVRNGKLRFAEWYYGPQERMLSAYKFIAYGPSTLYDRLQLTVSHQHIEESRINRSFGSVWRSHRIETVDIGSVNLDLSKTLGEEHELAYGGEFTFNQVGSHAFEEERFTREQRTLDTRYPDGGSQWQSGALYFTHRWEMTPRLIFTEGIRFNQISLTSRFVDKSFFDFPFEQIEQNNQALSGNLGGVVKLPAHWRISLLGATGFRSPNLDDVAKIFDSQPGNVVIPNPGLKPEYTYNLEFSLQKRWPDQAQVEVILYHTWYRNAIVVRTGQFNGADSVLYQGVRSAVQTNINAGQARIWGANFNAWWQIVPSLKLRHSLSYTFGQELTSEVPLDHIPPVFGQTSLMWQQGAWKAEISLPFQGWKRPKRYAPDDFANEEFATADGWPAWWMLQARLNYTLAERWEVQFGAENILDQHYRPYASRISAPGRNLQIGLRAKF